MNIESTAELLDYLRRRGHVRETECPRLTKKDSIDRSGPRGRSVNAIVG